MMMEVSFHPSSRVFEYRFDAIYPTGPADYQMYAEGPQVYAGHCNCRSCMNDPGSWKDVSLRHYDFKKVSAYIAYMTGRPIDSIRAFHHRQRNFAKEMRK